jgi:hypothetical protein
MYRDTDQTRDVKSTAGMFVQFLQKFLKESLMSFHGLRKACDVTAVAVQHADLYINTWLLMHAFLPFVEFQQQTKNKSHDPVSSFCNNVTK